MSKITIRKDLHIHEVKSFAQLIYGVLLLFGLLSVVAMFNRETAWAVAFFNKIADFVKLWNGNYERFWVLYGAFMFFSPFLAGLILEIWSERRQKTRPDALFTEVHSALVLKKRANLSYDEDGDVSEAHFFFDLQNPFTGKSFSIESPPQCYNQIKEGDAVILRTIPEAKGIVLVDL